VHAHVMSCNSKASVYNSLPYDDDVVRDLTIQELSQAVFSASPLGALYQSTDQIKEICAVSEDSPGDYPVPGGIIGSPCPWGI
jgi:hypothetical protein